MNHGHELSSRCQSQYIEECWVAEWPVYCNLFSLSNLLPPNLCLKLLTELQFGEIYRKINNNNFGTSTVCLCSHFHSFVCVRTKFFLFRAEIMLINRRHFFFFFKIYRLLRFSETWPSHGFLYHKVAESPQLCKVVYSRHTGSYMANTYNAASVAPSQSPYHSNQNLVINYRHG